MGNQQQNNNQNLAALMPATSIEQMPMILRDAGIDMPTYYALENAFPGALPASQLMAYHYCMARKLDILKKPVHIMSMQVTDKATGKKFYRDVIYPGIAENRITAARTGLLAGIDEPVFGDDIDTVSTVADNGNTTTMKAPKTAKVTVYKMVNGQRCAFTHIEYFEEAVARVYAGGINSMWRKRPHGQLAKCAEAGALRKAFPEELGGEPTAEEMMGRVTIDGGDAADDTGKGASGNGASGVAEPEEIVDGEFTDEKPPTATEILARQQDAGHPTENHTKSVKKAPAKKVTAKSAPKQAEKPPQSTPAPVSAAPAAPVAQEPAPAPAPAPEPEPATGGFKVELPEGAYGIINSQLRGKGVTEAALLAKLGADLTTKNINQALALLKAM